MKDLKFDKNRKRVKYCPCNRSNRDGKFAPFTGHDDRGYCHSCGETFLPELDPQNLNHFKNFKRKFKKHKISYHSPKLVKQSGQNPKKNNFIQQLKDDFPISSIKMAIKQYLIGTSTCWPGATIFWQIDNFERIRHGKIMLYDRQTGKRAKKGGFAYINSVRSYLNLKNHHLEQCLFGLHLINEYPNKKIALVEGEKTAIKMSMILPEYNWLATGSKSLLKYKYIKELRGFPIILFPDKGAFNEWEKIADDLKSLGFNIETSKWLENSSYPENTDFADLLINENTSGLTAEKDNSITHPTTVKTKTDKIAQRFAQNNTAFIMLIEKFGLVDKNGLPINL